MDEYYIGYNNGCAFHDDHDHCNYCLQIGVFAMSFATSVEFLKDFSHANNNNNDQSSFTRDYVTTAYLQKNTPIKFLYII